MRRHFVTSRALNRRADGLGCRSIEQRRFLQGAAAVNACYTGAGMPRTGGMAFSSEIRAAWHRCACRREREGEGNLCAVGEHIVLTALPAPVNRTLSRRGVPFKALAWDGSTAAHENVEGIHGPRLRHQSLMQTLSHAGLCHSASWRQSTSSPIQSPVPAAVAPAGSRCAARTGSLAGPIGHRATCGPDGACDTQRSAAAARSPPTTRLGLERPIRRTHAKSPRYAE